MVTVASHPDQSTEAYGSWTTHDLWMMLYAVVDMQVELQRNGQLREAVKVRRKARVIGTALRARYRNEFRY